MICKVCSEDQLRLLFRGEQCVHPKGHPCPDVYRCLACGSDSLANTYDEVRGLYDAAYIRHNLDDIGQDGCLEAIRSNVEWFRDYKPRAPGRDFLDIGCIEGTALIAMERDGWSVHGFDVIPQAYLGEHTTICTSGFRAGLFPQRYDAILCREVLEHVPDWRQLLAEIHQALDPGGLLQLQTPRPWDVPLWIPYQQTHLQIFAPLVLCYWLERIGFAICDYRFWDAGQCWMAQKL
jgi:2-polyprenyl-3-methyl-5-hydroxy-6-metoxy-1,4-benzoquinol methylase